MKQSRNDPVEAFTLVELLVVLAVVILLAVLIPVPPSRNKAKAKRFTCINNLKQIGLAFKTWPTGEEYPMGISLTNGGTMELTNSSLVFRTFLVMSNELMTPKILACPADDRVPAAAFDATLSNSNVSYFIGLDSSEEAPQMFLAGDRNLTNGLPVNNGVLLLPTNCAVGWDHQLHQGYGNVLLCDGSVQQLASPRLWQQLCATGTNGIRIMMPDIPLTAASRDVSHRSH
jgi:prepilin-type processing-associated H-X9-DG protein